MPEIFVDSHCHLFNVADFPLFQTIKQYAHDKGGMEDRLLIPFISFCLPLISPEKKVDDIKSFLNYFEREPDESVKQLAVEVNQILNSSFDLQGAKAILTPLVMDFDSGAEVTKLAKQVERLSTAISGNRATSITFLPFIGIDPRRKEADFLTWLDMTKSARQHGGFDGVVNGDFIGIKLYPSLGFRPQDHIQKYRLIAERQLPITVHCQKGALNLVKNADRLTDPRNWEEVFSVMKNDANKPLVNFAHFGGDDEILATVEFEDNSLTRTKEFVGFSKTTWTWHIIQMLKAHPDTYSDLSAFEFSKSENVAALKWILHLDRQGAFDILGMNNYSLTDKLLWGSDYPMTLKGRGVNYSTLYKNFVDAMNNTNDNRVQYPPAATGISGNAIIHKLVSDNPKKFLFG